MMLNLLATTLLASAAPQAAEANQTPTPQVIFAPVPTPSAPSPGPVGAGAPPVPAGWITLNKGQIAALADDDLQRHANEPAFLDGIDVAERRFTENGFDWHLLRFTSKSNPVGPLWAVPHDDENAAFESMIRAVKIYGGVGVAVNSGPGSSRYQAGYGKCGVRRASGSSCDPNRNFDAAAPLYTSAFMDQLPKGQPIIAFHTNKPGFSNDGHGGSGNITMVDMVAYRQGKIRTMGYSALAKDPVPLLDNHDTLTLLPWDARGGSPSAELVQCKTQLSEGGYNVYIERIDTNSDGSMSNYVVLADSRIGYVNLESRQETDLKLASDRHMAMLSGYVIFCTGGKVAVPVQIPAPTP